MGSVTLSLYTGHDGSRAGPSSLLSRSRRDRFSRQVEGPPVDGSVIGDVPLADVRWMSGCPYRKVHRRAFVVTGSTAAIGSRHRNWQLESDGYVLHRDRFRAASAPDGDPPVVFCVCEEASSSCHSVSGARVTRRAVRSGDASHRLVESTRCRRWSAARPLAKPVRLC
jgi:hypothetical protein